MRKVLPTRRRAETFVFDHDTLKFTATIGYYGNGRPGEIFLNCSKLGTGADSNARDAAIAVSIALQHGVEIDTLRNAMTRNSDGSASSPIGHLLDLLQKDSR
jgi:hypothetical protein